MRLDLLIDREPFAKIFSRTLSSYLASQFNWSGDICFKRRKPRRKNYFLVNTKLNLIHPRTLNTNTLRVLASEYAFHPHLIRRIAQRLYVHYAVLMPLQRLFSSYYVSVHPFPEECANWCILPGNNSIRIIDVESNECIVLQKDGFNKNYMRNLISLRKQFLEIPGPRILRAYQGVGWYSEERIQGLPLNRIDNDLLITSALKSARQSMLRLYDQTSSEVEWAVWRKSITQKIFAALDCLPDVYPSSLRKEVENTVNKFVVYLAKFHKEEKPIEIVQSHGDFQPANILIPTSSDQRPVYVIDWEYTEKRCRWYDAMVFELQSRSPIGLANRVSKWLSDEDFACFSIEWCGLDEGQSSARYVVGTFLLEDLLLRLVDTTIPGLRKPNSGFLSFIDELFSIDLDSTS